jgi:hypothetical protein
MANFGIVNITFESKTIGNAKILTIDSLKPFQGSLKYVTIDPGQLDGCFASRFLHPNSQMKPLKFHLKEFHDLTIDSIWIADHIFKSYIEENLIIIENIRWKSPSSKV